MKNLFLIFLIMNFSVLLTAQAASSESIQDIIDNNSNAVSDTSTVPDSPNSNESLSVPQNDNFFAIQAGTYLIESEANNQIIKLKTMGFDPYIFQSVNSKGANIYSVRIGKYDNYNDASSEVTRLENKLNLPLIITQFDTLNPASAPTIAKTKTESPTEPEIESEVANDDESSIPVNSSALKSLQKKIQDMENKIQQLQDASDIRKKLKITEEEANETNEDVLEAAGREYTLTKEGTIRLSYGLTYSYNSYDAIKESTRVEDVADHTISNNVAFSYGLKDNLTVGTSIPFIYKYHKVGTISSLETTDFGDLKLNWQLQPFKTNSDMPSLILNGNLGIPVGRNPYEIQPGEELSTSSGIYSANLGASVSQVSDPVIVFSSLSINYPFATQSINQKRDEGTLDEVDPGMAFGASIGLGYALSYRLNFNLSFSYSYSLGTTYKYKDASDAKSGTSTSASIGIGTGYKISRNQNLNLRIGLPITSNGSFSIGLSTPIDFEL